MNRHWSRDSQDPASSDLADAHTPSYLPPLPLFTIHPSIFSSSFSALSYTRLHLGPRQEQAPGPPL